MAKISCNILQEIQLICKDSDCTFVEAVVKYWELHVEETGKSIETFALELDVVTRRAIAKKACETRMIRPSEAKKLRSGKLKI